MNIILLVFLLILSILFIYFSIQSVIFAVDGVFVVPEQGLFNPVDYGGESSLSSEGKNDSEKFQNEDELYHVNHENLTGSINFTDFNFALAGDWGCTKDTAKSVQIIQNHDPDLVFNLGDTSYKKKDIKCWVDIVKPISDRMKSVIGNHDVI
jgi:hypothetical protein